MTLVNDIKLVSFYTFFFFSRFSRLPFAFVNRYSAGDKFSISRVKFVRVCKFAFDFVVNVKVIFQYIFYSTTGTYNFDD